VTLPEALRPRCYGAFAIARKSPAECDAIVEPGFRNECVYDFAKALADASSCLGLPDELRRRCAEEIFELSGDARLCSVLEPGLAATCYLAVAELDQEEQRLIAKGTEQAQVRARTATQLDDATRAVTERREQMLRDARERRARRGSR
jgi:hypothetical protein